MNYTYTDRKYTISPAMQTVLSGINSRILKREDRENTYSGPAFDGKTPFLDTFEEMPDAPHAEVLAHAIVRSWLISEPVILPYELIVGIPRPNRFLSEHFSFGIRDNSHVFPDDPLFLSMESELRARKAALEERLLPGCVPDYPVSLLGREMLGEDVYAATRNGLWSPGGYQGHTVPGYPKLLRLGFDKTLEEITKYESNTTDPEKLLFYQSLRILVNGLSRFAEQYAEKAEALAEAESDVFLRDRYALIAKTCRTVAHKRPETLLEAVQLMWFYCLWDWVDCIGRADQYLLPFYEKESPEIAKDEIITALMFKIREHGVHNVTLSGVIPETGENATNELTYLILQIARTIHDVHPRITVRVNKQTPPELMNLLVTMWSEGMSDPTLVSDTMVIDGLRKYGVSTEDARDYTILGCQEIEIPGKSNFGCEDGAFNLAKVMEYTLFNGYDRFNEIQVGPKTGKLTDFQSVEDIWNAFQTQVRFFTGRFTELCNIGQTVRDKNLAKLVKSIYTDDCIARGVNLDGGGAIYNYGVIETAGTAVVADAFTALETVVFGTGQVSLEELASALEDNFVGHEETRRILLSAPKFGNDDDRADNWCVRVLNFFWTEIGKYRSVRGGVFMGACSLLTGGIGYGEKTWALPDGHRLGDPLGNTMGARPGADHSGTTALLKSVAKLPLHLGLGGTTLNVLVPCRENDSEEQKAKIAALFRTFMENGGQMAQITTANVEEMRDAQLHPEQHENLIVRIGGYSAKFNECDRKMQNEVISRYA